MVINSVNVKISELLAQNASSFEVSKYIKTEIQSYLGSLDEDFAQTKGKIFFIRHTKKIDFYITILYKYLLQKYFGRYVPAINALPISLIALGSYAREQLCVYSDIDILVLYEKTKGYDIVPIIEELLTIAWDCGLKLGSRVHQLNDIEKASSEDITIKTSFLESRFIYGSRQLWSMYQNNLTHIRHHEEKKFIFDKIAEKDVRLKKYPLNMQPNIKDGYGGMRDSNVLFWIANSVYGVSSIKQLIGVLFDDDDYKEYRQSLEYIFQVRNGLHLLAKKKLDSVTFDILPELSDVLGFKDSVKFTKERQCSAKLFKSLHKIHNFCEINTKKIINRYLFDAKNISQLRKSRISKNIFVCKNTVFASFNIKAKEFELFLEELAGLKDEELVFDASFQSYAMQIKAPRHISKYSYELVGKLLARKHLYVIINLLYKSDLLKAVFPNLIMIINQPQFDGYHKHPVDVHSLNTLKFVENIKDEFILDLYSELTNSKKSLLKLVALYHDSGKGRKQDHRISGQGLFQEYANKLAISQSDVQIGKTLIKYHTTMSYVATKEDLYSYNNILRFMGMIRTKEVLNLLYILTYADISSVDDGVFVKNKMLLNELYHQGLRALKDTDLLKTSSRRMAKIETIKKLPEFNDENRIFQKKILNIKSDLLFLKTKALDIIKIANLTKAIDTKYFEIKNEDKLNIKIIRSKELNLGYLLGKLSYLDIVSMDIFKLFDNFKLFDITFGDMVDEQSLSALETIINDSFDMDKKIELIEPVILKDEVSINQNHTDELISFKIQTKNQKGLFSYIADLLDTYKIEIQSAKLHTVGKKVNDLLLIERNDNFILNQDEIINKICVQSSKLHSKSSH